MTPLLRLRVNGKTLAVITKTNINQQTVFVLSSVRYQTIYAMTDVEQDVRR